MPSLPPLVLPGIRPKGELDLRLFCCLHHLLHDILALQNLVLDNAPYGKAIPNALVRQVFPKELLMT